MVERDPSHKHPLKKRLTLCLQDNQLLEFTTVVDIFLRKALHKMYISWTDAFFSKLMHFLAKNQGFQL